MHSRHGNMLSNMVSAGIKVLILIFATYFLQALFNQARLPCRLNSCIIFYFYSFKHGPSSCDILGEIKKVWFGGYRSVPFGPFA